MTELHDEYAPQDEELVGPGDSKGPSRGVPQDRPTRLLIGIVFAFLVAVLATTGVVVFIALNPPPAPRTAAERAIEVSAAAVEIEPESPEAWSEYIRVLTVSEEYGAASEAVADAYSLVGDDDPLILAEEARLVAARGGTDEALQMLDDAIADLQVLREEYIQDRKDEGIEMIESPYDEDIVAATVLKGEILFAAGDMDGAVDAYTAALELNPTMSDVLVARGHSHEATGRIEEARADFELALTFAPDYVLAQEGLDRVGGGSD